MNNYCFPKNAIAAKYIYTYCLIYSYRIIQLEAKNAAINDCLMTLRSNEDLPLGDTLKSIRKLSSKQFMVIMKRNRLLAHVPQQVI